MSNNNNNFEDEIKEEIEVYDDFETDENVLKNIETTYDKFLLESCAFDGKQNEYHNLLKNQMKNIIYEIKEKKQENHKNQINTKKKLFVDFENILNGKNDNKNDNFNCDLNKKNYDVTFNKNFNNNNNFSNENNNNNNENNNNDKKNVIKEKEYNLDYDNNDKLIESSDSKSYNINIDDFIKDNTMNDDIVNNVGNNSYLLNNNNKNINNNNINNNNMINNNNNNNNEINYNNNNKDNKYNYNNNNNNNNYNYNNNNNNYNNNNYNNNNNNKNFIYTLKDDPQHEKTIQENLNAFKKYNNQNTKKQEKLSDRFNSLYSNPRYSNNNNNNHNNSNNNIIYVDDCKNSSERKQQQKHFDEMKQKKLKQLEERIQKNRSRSKPKITNKNNTNLQSDFSLNNNNKIKKRPTTANTKKIIITAQNNKNKIRPSTAKSNNLSTPANNLSNLTNNTTINSNYSHISTRIPVKITREQSKIANKKVKNVKYNKMSNKNSIKKAIAEVCLAGIPNKDYREQILKIIDNCSCENYIILFRNYGRFDLKAVYTYDVEKDYIELLTCINNAPDFLENEQIFKFYKFNVAKNQFSELNGIKNFSVIVDGICIKN